MSNNSSPDQAKFKYDNFCSKIFPIIELMQNQNCFKQKETPKPPTDEIETQAITASVEPPAESVEPPAESVEPPAESVEPPAESVEPPTESVEIFPINDTRQDKISDAFRYNRGDTPAEQKEKVQTFLTSQSWIKARLLSAVTKDQDGDLADLQKKWETFTKDQDVDLPGLGGLQKKLATLWLPTKRNSFNLFLNNPKNETTKKELDSELLGSLCQIKSFADKGYVGEEKPFQASSAEENKPLHPSPPLSKNQSCADLDFTVGQAGLSQASPEKSDKNIFKIFPELSWEIFDDYADEQAYKLKSQGHKLESQGHKLESQGQSVDDSVLKVFFNLQREFSEGEKSYKGKLQYAVYFNTEKRQLTFAVLFAMYKCEDKPETVLWSGQSITMDALSNLAHVRTHFLPFAAKGKIFVENNYSKILGVLENSTFTSRKMPIASQKLAESLSYIFSCSSLSVAEQKKFKSMADGIVKGINTVLPSEAHDKAKERLSVKQDALLNYEFEWKQSELSLHFFQDPASRVTFKASCDTSNMTYLRLSVHSPDKDELLLDFQDSKWITPLDNQKAELKSVYENYQFIWEEFKKKHEKCDIAGFLTAQIGLAAQKEQTLIVLAEQKKQVLESIKAGWLKADGGLAPWPVDEALTFEIKDALKPCVLKAKWSGGSAKLPLDQKAEALVFLLANLGHKSRNGLHKDLDKQELIKGWSQDFFNAMNERACSFVNEKVVNLRDLLKSKKRTNHLLDVENLSQLDNDIKKLQHRLHLTTVPGFWARIKQIFLRCILWLTSLWNGSPLSKPFFTQLERALDALTLYQDVVDLKAAGDQKQLFTVRP